MADLAALAPFCGVFAGALAAGFFALPFLAVFFLGVFFAAQEGLNLAGIRQLADQAGTGRTA